MGLVRIGQTTLVGTYYGSLNAFLTWARTKTGWRPPEFVFNLKSAEAPPAQPRDAFRDDELLRFFSLPLFTGCASEAHIWKPGPCFVQSELYWGYLLHIFTGLRPSEIGALLTGDLVNDGGVWFIDLRRDSAKSGRRRTAADPADRKLKSPAAYRRVPVPALLIDLGLADRKAALEAAGRPTLFPEWHVYHHPQSGRPMLGHHLSKSWQYVKKEHGFDRELLTLYSGRHTLAGWYDAAGIAQRVRDRLLGHTPQSVPGGYGPVDLTADEAKSALAVAMPVHVAIADVLLTAKLKAEYGMLSARPVVPARDRS